jgi:hypothetical protein
VYGQQIDIQLGRSRHRVRYGVRDIVIFQVEEDLLPLLLQLPHDIGTGTRKQRRAYFVKRNGVAKALYQPHGRRVALHVERYD